MDARRGTHSRPTRPRRSHDIAILHRSDSCGRPSISTGAAKSGVRHRPTHHARVARRGALRPHSDCQGARSPPADRPGPQAHPRLGHQAPAARQHRPGTSRSTRQSRPLASRQVASHRTYATQRRGHCPQRHPTSRAPHPARHGTTSSATGARPSPRRPGSNAGSMPTLARCPPADQLGTRALYGARPGCARGADMLRHPWRLHTSGSPP